MGAKSPARKHRGKGILLAPPRCPAAQTRLRFNPSATPVRTDPAFPHPFSDSAPNNSRKKPAAESTPPGSSPGTPSSSTSATSATSPKSPSMASPSASSGRPPSASTSPPPSSPATTPSKSASPTSGSTASSATPSPTPRKSPSSRSIPTRRTPLSSPPVSWARSASCANHRYPNPVGEAPPSPAPAPITLTASRRHRAPPRWTKEQQHPPHVPAPGWRDHAAGRPTCLLPRQARPCTAAPARAHPPCPSAP